MGFKQIEVGFPAASQTDFDFVRSLIEEDWIPDDVVIQVLTQAREDLIRRTMDSIRGAKRAIVHLYNSTSTLQRRVVFGMDRVGVTALAVDGTKLIRELCDDHPDTEVVLEYSPESFTGTEIDYAVEICDAVTLAWGAGPGRPVILNLPATVEMSTPNVYADLIETFCRNVARRDSVVVSVHPHNDRGTAVAAAELAVMAGAQRVEGTLFGNGERTGNVDVVTLALNLMTQGVDPELQMHDINELIRVAEHCNRLPVHPRHPYAGELVFTAFSGSHQDAIKKGFAALDHHPGEHWEVPYLPVDPADLGRTYDAVIRINSQSGKGGIAYVLEKDYGLILPRRLLIEFSQVVQALAEERGEELSGEDLWRAFEAEYLGKPEPLDFVSHRETSAHGDGRMASFEAEIVEDGVPRQVRGEGNGPIDAFVDALRAETGRALRVADYREHSLGQGADAVAIAYVEVINGAGESLFGVARHADIVTASLQAVVCAANRSERDRPRPS
jgi:2-isopropylmalate synthase